MRKNKKGLIAVLLVLSMLLVSIPAFNSSYSDDSLKNMYKYTSLMKYIDATSELLADYPAQTDETLMVNVETDTVYDQDGNIVEHYDNAIAQALTMSVPEASQFLTSNQYKVIDSDKFTVTVDNIYQARRIIVETDEPISETMGAVKVLSYYDEYILQYEDEHETMHAFEYFRGTHYENLYLDLIIDADSDVDDFREVSIDSLSNGNKDHYSWGVTTMGLDTMQANLEAQIEYELPEILVAVIDTGIATENKYLQDRFVDYGYNFITDTADVEDDNGHGTHVSGIVADGTSSNVKVLPLKALNSEGKGSLLYVKNAMLYALEKNADVFNLSLSAEDTNRTVVYLDSTFKTAIENNCIPVVSAGNENSDVMDFYPSRSPYAITIAAIDNTMTKASYSNYGSKIDFALPGSSIISAYQSGLAYKSGTSMASPHGAAAIALLKTWKPTITFDEVMQVLANNSIDLGDAGKDDYYGYGCINLATFDVTRGAHEHNYQSNVIKEPTCTEEGTMEYICKDCGHRYEEVIPAKGHDFNITVVNPTCTEEGYSTYECKNCNESYTADRTAPLGHKFSVSATVPATCTTDGMIVKMCDRCQENFSEPIKATGHSYNSVITKEPTHEEDGIRTYTCEKCGDSYEEAIPKEEHSFTFTRIDPTCTEGGFDKYTCDCGYSYTENPTEPLGHAFELSEHKDATCIDEGYDKYKCSRCDEEYSEPIAVVDHQYIHTVIQEATCTEPGIVEYRCSVCGDTYQESTISLGHSYNSTVVKPTCDMEGYTLHKCERCGHEYQDEVTQPIGHDYTMTTTPATCTQDGKITYKCKNCGDEYSETIPSAGHNYIKETYPATCEKDGYYMFTCSVCGDSYRGETIPALGHNFVDIVVEPTCTERGYTIHECSRCDKRTIDSYTDIIPHNYKISAHEDAKCLEDGFTEFECTMCKDSYKETIPALGHNYKTSVINPTCIEEGYTLHQCERCDDSYKDNFTDKIEHEYEAVITKQPTHTEKGITTYTCKYCGDSYTEEIPASEHVYEIEVIAPTCEHEGYTIYKCKDCGYSYEDNFVDKIQHEYEAKITKEATCKEEGVITYTCKHCGDSYTESIDMIEHVFEDKVVDPTCTERGYTLHTCKNCGHTYKDSITELIPHDESEWIIDRQPTCTEEGLKHKECSMCHKVIKQETIVKTPHDYKESVVEPTRLTRGYTKHTCKNCGYSYNDNYVDPSSGIATVIYKVFDLIRGFFGKP